MKARQAEEEKKLKAHFQLANQLGAKRREAIRDLDGRLRQALVDQRFLGDPALKASLQGAADRLNQVLDEGAFR